MKIFYFSGVWAEISYIGKKKTHLHNFAVASAVNVVRGVAWLEGKPLKKKQGFKFC